MPKNKVSEYSATAANNTDIGGINIAEGCAPSGINNAIRELMAQIKDMQTGADLDNFTVGGNLSVTGTLTVTSTTELNGATKLFLNAASSTAAAPPLSWSGDTNTGIYSPAADNIGLSTGGVERLRVNSTGALIIGSGEATTSPSGNILRASSGSGTNIPGANFEINAGNGTGTGGSGSIIFKTADVGTSGSTANTLTQRLLITPKGGFSFGSGSTSYGTAGQVLTSNGDAPPSFQAIGGLTFDTVKNSTSGTSVEFTGISSTVKRITLIFNNVSTNGSNPFLFQLGDAGGFETTSYAGSGTIVGSASTTAANYTVGFGFDGGATAKLWHGTITFVNISGNIWVASGVFGRSDGANSAQVGGVKTLSDVLTQIRVIGSTNGSPTDTFDSGSINVIYE